MWKDSIYKFRIPWGVNKHGLGQLKEVVFDVTLSAPRFGVPEKDADIVKHVFNPVLDLVGRNKPLSILDVGAGKLRFTLYFLKKGYKVCAVEYENLKKRSKQMQKNLAKAKEYGERFLSLTYPLEFIASKDKTYDLALLINVINTMPVPYERLLLLEQCYRKLKAKGYLLCCTWFGQRSFTDSFDDDVNLIGDGYYMGEETKHKSFAIEYKSVEELDEIILANGFEFVKPFPIGKVKARLYRKKRGKAYTFFSRALSKSKLKKAIPVYKSIKDPTSTQPKIVLKNQRNRVCIPNPEELRMEELYAEVLRSLSPGQEDALKYQRLIYLILGRLFRPNLKNFKFEKTTTTERIDITVTNDSEKGFWMRLSNKHQIPCGWIMFECKNEENDPENTDFQQISSRLKPRRGRFGMLVCRKTKNFDKLLQRCKSFLDKDEYIMPIEDSDILHLLDFKMKGLEVEIDDYLSEKFENLFF